MFWTSVPTKPDICNFDNSVDCEHTWEFWFPVTDLFLRFTVFQKILHLCLFASTVKRFNNLCHRLHCWYLIWHNRDLFIVSGIGWCTVWAIFKCCGRLVWTKSLLSHDFTSSALSLIRTTSQILFSVKYFNSSSWPTPCIMHHHNNLHHCIMQNQQLQRSSTLHPLTEKGFHCWNS